LTRILSTTSAGPGERSWRGPKPINGSPEQRNRLALLFQHDLVGLRHGTGLTRDTIERAVAGEPLDHLVAAASRGFSSGQRTDPIRRAGSRQRVRK
jgi:hypothetical protein